MNSFSSRGYGRCRRVLVSAALLVASLAIAGAALARTELPARVQVTWAPPEQLAEVQHNQFGYGLMRPADWMALLGDYLRVRADRILPEGQQLQVTIDDITLAGSFEPWHGHGQLDDARFMRDIYPPRLKLHYRLIGADGSTLREKDVNLIDMGYLQHTGLPSDTDPLRFDKRQIDHWLRREFGPKRS